MLHTDPSGLPFKKVQALQLQLLPSEPVCLSRFYSESFCFQQTIAACSNLILLCLACFARYAPLANRWLCQTLGPVRCNSFWACFWKMDVVVGCFDGSSRSTVFDSGFGFLPFISSRCRFRLPISSSIWHPSHHQLNESVRCLDRKENAMRSTCSTLFCLADWLTLVLKVATFFLLDSS